MKLAKMILPGVLLGTATLGTALVLVLQPSSLAAQQPVEYKTAIGCYVHGIGNPGNLQAGVQGMLNDHAREGWVAVDVSVYPVNAPLVSNAACALVTLQRP